MSYDEILNRGIYIEKLQEFLNTFENNSQSLSQMKRGLYLYGKAGIGKTTFIKNVLNDKGFDMVYYDSSDVRNKSILDVIATDNMSNVNVHSMFTKKKKKIVIVMDDVDGMNSGDKGGINTLIKLIRPKRTKKQKQEALTLIPIICIGGTIVDKKIKELMSVCNTIELNTPNTKQIERIIKMTYPSVILTRDIYDDVGCDLRKINLLRHMSISNEASKQQQLETKPPIINVKTLTRDFLNNAYDLSQHDIITDADRTTLALLWHENIIDMMPLEKNLELYGKLLDNICFGDYIDRLMFQKQIWEFNEMTSLIKTMYNNKLLHNSCHKIIKKHNDEDIRFTKVLTKYSSEYNNMVFINNVCRELNMAKNDLHCYILSIQDDGLNDTIDDLVEITELTKLDVLRLCKYVNYVTYGRHSEVDEN